MIRKQFLSMLALGVGLGAMMVVTSQPVNSVSTVQLRGSAGPAISLSSGSVQTLTVAPGTAGSSSVVVAADLVDFTETFNYGDLTTGDGTNSVATVSLRTRSNVPAHVTWSIPTYTSSTIQYNGVTLTGGAGSGGELTFITCGQTAVNPGTNGSTAGHSYSFGNGTTLAANLGATVGAAHVTTSPKFCSFASRASTSGSLASTDNWAQNGVSFTVPTGLVWSPTPGQASGNWAVDVQFAIWPGP